MKTDFEGTLAKVAATGYKEVEFAGYFDHSPKDVRAILDKNALASPSCHVGYDVVRQKSGRKLWRPRKSSATATSSAPD